MMKTLRIYLVYIAVIVASVREKENKAETCKSRNLNLSLHVIIYG